MAKPRSAVRDQKDTLKVLGVLKVATAMQTLYLVRPHLTDNKVIRNALLNLEAAGEVVSEGNTAGPAERFGVLAPRSSSRRCAITTARMAWAWCWAGGSPSTALGRPALSALRALVCEVFTEPAVIGRFGRYLRPIAAIRESMA